MRKNYNRDDVIDICVNILFKEYDYSTENMFSILVEACMESLVKNKDYEVLTWVLTTLNFLQTTNMQDRVKFIKIETLKLNLMTSILANNEYILAQREDSITGESKEIYKEFEIADIYKRYIPNEYSKFRLPPQGEEFTLRIVQPAKNGAEFEANVKIDSRGFVTQIISEPKYTDKIKSQNDIEDIYTDLMSDILKYGNEE